MVVITVPRPAPAAGAGKKADHLYVELKRVVDERLRPSVEPPWSRPSLSHAKRQGSGRERKSPALLVLRRAYGHAVGVRSPREIVPRGLPDRPGRSTSRVTVMVRPVTRGHRTLDVQTAESGVVARAVHSELLGARNMCVVSDDDADARTLRPSWASRAGGAGRTGETNVALGSSGA
jgi:hypothetical protein